MNIISCEGCGVVLDLGRINAPNMEDKDGNINNETASWRNSNYEPKIACPVCKTKIFYIDGNKAY